MGCLHILDLPPEILTVISAHLPRRDLKTARLTSKKLNSIASLFLFRIIYLRVGIKSFTRLQNIANHPTLCQHVHVISYDPWRMKNASEVVASEARGPIDLYELWKTLDLESKYRENKYDEQQLRALYADWCDRVADLKALTQDLEMKILTEVVRKLPKLEGLQFDLHGSGEFHLYSEGAAQSIWQTSTAACKQPDGNSPRTLAYPAQSAAFGTLLKAALNSGRASSITKVQARGLFLAHNSGYGLPDCISDLAALSPNITGLDLQFEQPKNSLHSALDQMLIDTPHLQHLALSFPYFSFALYRQMFMPRADDFTMRQHTWPHLKHVSFENLWTTDSLLRGFLRRHRRSLRSLELRHILLHPGDKPLRIQDPEETEEYRKGNEDVGSWLDLIEFLRSTLSLKRMRFGGILANGRNEAWKVRDTSMDLSGRRYEEQLKTKIEDYICHKGENPIERVPRERVESETRSNTEFDLRGLEIPYIWEDDSWHMWINALPRLHDPNELEGPDW